jgi:hypothetical protein
VRKARIGDHRALERTSRPERLALASVRIEHARDRIRYRGVVQLFRPVLCCREVRPSKQRAAERHDCSPGQQFDDALGRSADLIGHQYSAPAPNRLGVADITYVKTHSGGSTSRS